MTGIGFSPLAGLTPPRPITVKLDGTVYTIRGAMADVWLEGWAQWGVDRVMLAMLEGKADEYRYFRSMSRGPDGAAAAIEASRRLFGQAAGVEWWTADRLAFQSVGWAGVGGELYSQGLRPADVPLAVWLAGALRVLMLSTPKESRAAVEGSLMMPPDGYDTGELPQDASEFFTP
jgi:hypothetical protein